MYESGWDRQNQFLYLPAAATKTKKTIFNMYQKFSKISCVEKSLKIKDLSMGGICCQSATRRQQLSIRRLLGPILGNSLSICFQLNERSQIFPKSLSILISLAFLSIMSSFRMLNTLILLCLAYFVSYP